MTQLSNLCKMNLAPLVEVELNETSGGHWLWDALRTIGVEKAVDYIWDSRKETGGFIAYMVKNPIRPSQYR